MLSTTKITSGDFDSSQQLQVQLAIRYDLAMEIYELKRVLLNKDEEIWQLLEAHM